MPYNGLQQYVPWLLQAHGAGPHNHLKAETPKSPSSQREVSKCDLKLQGSLIDTAGQGRGLRV